MAVILHAFTTTCKFVSKCFGWGETRFELLPDRVGHRAPVDVVSLEPVVSPQVWTGGHSPHERWELAGLRVGCEVDLAVREGAVLERDPDWQIRGHTLTPVSQSETYPCDGNNPKRVGADLPVDRVGGAD